MFKIILFPIDQSREALETVSKAIELALSEKSQMIMLSVVEAKRDNMNNPQSVASLLQKAKEKVEQAGIHCDVVEREGNPAFVICDVADELNVDLIVMGTRGVNLQGDNESTASRVIHMAPCPVLVVP